MSIDLRPKDVLTGVIAASGDFTLPADTAEEAGAGHLSIEKGWNVETQTPIEEGGVPPFRQDFNGILNLFSQWIRLFQSGGTPDYDARCDYVPGCEVMQDGIRWRCLKATGPSTGYEKDGVVYDRYVYSPLIDQAYGFGFWTRVYDAHPGDGLPVGAIMPFKVQRLERVDGDAASYPVFIGQTGPDTHWALCNGATTADGFVTPDMRNKFIVSKSDAVTGADGLTDTVADIVTYGDHVPVGALLHTAAPLPASVRGDRWFSCEGATLSKAEYPEYAEQIAGRTNVWGVDSADSNTFNVPNLVGRYLHSIRLAGSSSKSGWGTTEGATLPAITGGGLFWEAYDRATMLSGAFYQSPTKGWYGSNGGADWDNYTVMMDASRCSSIYGAATRDGFTGMVHPAHANVLTYFHAKGPAAPKYAAAGTPAPTDAVGVCYFIKVKAYD